MGSSDDTDSSAMQIFGFPTEVIRGVGGDMTAANKGGVPGVVLYPDVDGIADRLGIESYDLAKLFAKYQDTMKDILQDHINDLIEEWAYNEGLVPLADPDD